MQDKNHTYKDGRGTEQRSTTDQRPVGVVPARHARHLQDLADSEENMPARYQLDPALTGSAHRARYFASAAATIVLAATVALSDLIKRW